MTHDDDTTDSPRFTVHKGGKLTSNGPEVLPEKAANFAARIHAGDTVHDAMQVSGIDRKTLASTAFRACLESLLPWVPSDPDQGRKLVLGTLYRTMLTSEDEKARLTAASHLQKDPSLGFQAGGPTVEVSVLSEQVRAMPVNESDLFNTPAASAVVEITPEPTPKEPA